MNTSMRDWDSVPHLFFEQAKRLNDKPFLWAKNNGTYQAINWNEAARQVCALADTLKSNGVKSGDRVMLVSENRPEWLIADIAIMSIGGITVPAYTTNTARDHLHIIENSGAKGAIISTNALSKNYFKAALQTNCLKFAITMEDHDLEQDLSFDIKPWSEATENAVHNIDDYLEASKLIPSTKTACLIYTSGTGGAPKGVMLHHGALLHNALGAKEVVDELEIGDERFLCFLPLSHAYEHTAGEILPLCIGAEIFYAESLDKLATNMLEARPTIMTVVPRLFEMLQSRITRAIANQGGLPHKLFDRAIRLGKKRLLEPDNLTLSERAQNIFLDHTVRKKVKARFGGHIKALVSGGAPLTPDVGYFFAALGLPLLQGYGQTESAPVISVNRPNSFRMDTVGPILANTEVKIAEDGEILVKGELVMQGYWRDEENTAAVIKNGWLHTGDIGEFTDEGHLKITDRKKDILINDKGDNVAPQRIEGLMTLENEIAQTMVYGDRKPHMVALIVPDGEWLAHWCRTNDKPNDLKALAYDKDLHKALDVAVKRVNERLSVIEKIRRFAVADESFSIDNEQMTPTMKIRRHVISNHYRDRLEGMY